MRIILSILLLTIAFSLKVNAQCGINDCPTPFIFTFDPPQIIGESIQFDNIHPQFFTCLLSDEFSIGLFGAGVDIYIYQLLPDGTRMNNCNVLNDYPNNVVAKDVVTYSVGDFCGAPFGSFNLTIDDTKGFVPCDGAVYEIVAATWVDSLGVGTTVDAGELPRTVYDVWPNGNNIYFMDTVMGTLSFNLNGGFTPGIPNTTSTIREWNTNQTTVISSGCDDVELFIEAMSVIANCIPYSDPTTGITSELSNELYFTINDGNPIDLLDGVSPEGGILSGPDSLLNGNCYAGIYTANNPIIVPISQFDLCDEDTLKVYLNTTDQFTGNTVSDEMTILINGNGCNPCPPPCNFSVNSNYDCNSEELCVNAPNNTAIAWGPSTEFGGSQPSTVCVTVSPGFSTNYFVEVVDVYGCSAADVINIGYNGDVDVGADISIFDGESIPLQAALPGGYDFSWTPNLALSNNLIANPVASPSTTTTYTVIATNANGCVSTDEITITVFPTNALVFEVGNIIPVCNEFEPINVDANFFPFTTCVWTLPDGSQVANCELNLSSPSLGSYICEINDTITSQTGIDSFTLTLDAVHIEAGPDQNLCLGAFAQLNATTAGILSYSWTGSNLSDLNVANPTFVASAPQVYSVTGVSEAGCSSTDVVEVFVQDLIVNAGNDQIICEGDSTFLDASSIDIVDYQWLSGVIQSDIPDPLVTPAITTTYTVIATNDIGCTATDDITITVLETTSISAGTDLTINEGESINLNAFSSDSYVDFEWSPSIGLSCISCLNPDASPSETTIYTLSADNGDCISQDQVTITVIPLNSLNEIDKLFKVEVNHNNIKISSDVIIDNVRLSDINGKNLYQNINSNSNFTFTSNGFAKGIYVLSIVSSGKSYSKKIMLY